MRADLRLEGLGVALAVVALAGAGALWNGAGFVNGDAAAYLVQALEGDLGQRTTHLGYLALASWLVEQVADPALALDRLSTASAILAVLGAAAVVRSGEGRPGVAAVATAAVLLPVACHAEVDPLWIAAVVWARALPGPLAGGVFALGVSVSPVALLAAPWAAWGSVDRGRWIAGGAVLAVLGLTGWTEGAWWVGDRGVLGGPLPRPLRALEGWGTALPWALLPLALIAEQRDEAELLTWVPMLLAPPDVPAWVIPGTSLALRAARGATVVPEGVPAVLVGMQLAIGGFTARAGARTVVEEQAVVAQLAAELGPRDGLIAPFTWGARVGVAASGDPYGVRWRPSGGFLRDQREAWCGAPFERVAVLPPGEDGIRWLEADDPALREGC